MFAAAVNSTVQPPHLQARPLRACHGQRPDSPSCISVQQSTHLTAHLLGCQAQHSHRLVAAVHGYRCHADTAVLRKCFPVQKVRPFCCVVTCCDNFLHCDCCIACCCARDWPRRWCLDNWTPARVQVEHAAIAPVQPTTCRHSTAAAQAVGTAHRLAAAVGAVKVASPATAAEACDATMHAPQVYIFVQPNCPKSMRCLAFAQ